MLYMVTFTINIPPMLAYIYTINGSYGICKWSIVYDSIRCEPHLLAGSIPIVTEAKRDSNAGHVVQQRWVKLAGLDRVWRDRQMKCSLPRKQKNMPTSRVFAHTEPN